MNNTIFNRILAHIQSKGIIVSDVKRLESYITNYNYNRVMKPYIKLYSEQEIKEYQITTDDILNIYELDKKISILFLRNILEIEKRLNTAIAYIIEDTFKIYDGCIFKYEKKFIQQHVFSNCGEAGLGFDQLISKLTKYAHINPNTNIYEDTKKNNLFMKWKVCPLDALCLTWTFTTTALTYLSLDNRLKEKIIQSFGVSKGRIKEFNIFIRTILNLRNIITHNNVLISNLECLSDSDLLHSYNEIIGGRKQFLTIFELGIFIQFFSKDTTLYETLYKSIIDCNFNPKIKQAIITMIGGMKND